MTEADSQGAPPRRRGAFKVALVLLSTVLTLVALEAAVRFTGTRVVRDSADPVWGLVESHAEMLVDYTPTGRRLIPNSRVTIHNHRVSGRNVEMRINSIGVRGPELPPTKPPGAIRILVVGDSVTWGDYLPEEDVWVARTEQHLRDRLPGRDIRAINAGVGDFGLREEIDLLEEKISAVDPDWVVIGYYLNDARPPWGFTGEMAHRGWLRRHSALAETVYRRLKLKRWVAERGEDRFAWVASRERLNWKGDRAQFLQLARDARHDWGAGWDPESWPHVEGQLRRLVSLQQQARVRVVVLALPVAFQVYADFVEDTPQRDLKRRTEQLGFSYVDVLPALRRAVTHEAARPLFFDQCHPTERGNDVIGRELAAFFGNALRE